MKEKHQSLRLRLEAIKTLINEQRIADQNTLVDLLMSRFGIKTNQSILSRDLRKLGVIKSSIDRKMIYTFSNFDVTVNLLKLAVVDIKYNETMIVVETHPGLAAFVGDYIDSKKNSDILGCLAGENVVFIACQSIKNIHEIYCHLHQELYFSQN